MTAKPGVLIQAARALLAGALLLLGGCAAVFQQGQVVNGPLPPAQPGTARMIFYRATDYQASQAMPVLYLNGNAVATTQGSSMLYRDLPPGTYSITVAPTLPFPNQFKTVTVKAGDVEYVQIGTLATTADIEPTERTFGTVFVVNVVDPAWGAYQIYGLHLISG